jgi:hypothetical protein
MERFKQTYLRGKRNNQTLLKRINRDMKKWLDKHHDGVSYVKPQITWIGRDKLIAEIIVDRAVMVN